ncbi:MAG: hypothetical protein K1V76_03540, partial [Candidatus Amulumruptor sp.]
MKTINKVFMAAGLGLSMMASSCTSDLDLMPTDPQKITAGSFDEDPEGYMDRVMADCYLQFATYGANGNASVSGTDGGMTTFQRALFILETIPTDEANWLPSADADYGLIQYGIASPSNTIMYGVYSRLMINVAVCTDFIQTVNNGYFNLPDDAKWKAEEYLRQAKILRAGAYYYLIDLWGNVPYASDDTSIGSVPPQMDRAELFGIMTTELEQIVAAYGGNASQSWGYVGKEVAEALLVKYYLNAEVYTGTPRWADCIRHAENLINRHKGNGFVASDGTATGLAKNYSTLFAANNRQYANGGSGDVHENLWVIPSDVEHMTSYANAMFMMEVWIGGGQQARYNVADAWKCASTRPEFAALFDWDSSMDNSEDQRVAWWCTADDGFSFSDLIYNQASWGNNGYLPIKYTN